MENKRQEGRRQQDGKRQRRAKPQKKQSIIEERGFIERTISVNRVSKVTKGGRNFGFNAIIAVGDCKGRIGVGLGKATELPAAVRKGQEEAMKSMISIPLTDGRTIPHLIIGKSGAGQVILRPATSGTGVIAGTAVRAIMECAGIKDILTKAQGSNNPHNVVKATMQGLKDLILIDEVSRYREAVVARRNTNE